MPYRQLVIALGAGQCGLSALADLVSRQPHCSMTYEQSPLLPWQIRRDRSQVQERIERWRSTAASEWTGDAASFYLPYVDAILEAEPNCKILCLSRDPGETRDAYRSWLHRNYPLPIDHWRQSALQDGLHCPVRSRLYPKYAVSDLDSGLWQYLREYRSLAEHWAANYPDRFRIFDAAVALDTAAGQAQLLDFLGIDSIRRVGGSPVWNQSEDPDRPRPRVRAAAVRGELDPRGCVILVPFGTSIVPQCDEALRDLERRGYPVRRVGGYAAIDQGRNQMATDALLDGYRETLWIDADIGFDPSAVDRLRSIGAPIVCGIYSQKGRRALACHVQPDTPQMVFGPNGSVHNILYAATGFLYVRREVYLTVQSRLDLPLCNERFGNPTIPFFQPAVRPDADGDWYLAEDYAFSDRVRRCGFRILADATIRLWHYGSYAYGWEDAGRNVQRFDSFTLNFTDTGTEAKPQ